MYSRAGRGLLIVGRQFGRKLYENTSRATGAVGCAVTSATNCAPSNYVLHRSYCNKNSDELAITPPKLLPVDEDAELKLKELLAVPENERMRNMIELEIEILRQNNQKVPTILKPRSWLELLNLNTRTKRKRYLEFMWSLEKKRENAKKKKEEKQRLHEEEVANSTEPKTIYRLGENTMFFRIYESTMNHMMNGRLFNRMMFGQPLVLDCSYESYMSVRERRYCAKQMQLSFASNRMHDDPFDLQLCNVNIHGDLMKHLHRYIPPLYNNDFPITIKTNSYLDCFDKKRLVYLTPHCHQEMTEFDHDAVYIVGAFVDQSSFEPVSMAKAKKESLKMLKLPLDKYLSWGSSSGKNLTINQVVDILLDLRLSGSWDEALKHVPRRKLFNARVNQLERRVEHVLRQQSSDNEENYTSPVQEPKVKEKFLYKPNRSYKPKVDGDYGSNSRRDTDSNHTTKQDFTMKARAKFPNNWKH